MEATVKTGLKEMWAAIRTSQEMFVAISMTSSQAD
jgi:hypothetical protein